MSGGALLICGGTGYTGRLIATEALKRGIPTALSGRDEDKTRRIASELGTDFRVTPTNDALRWSQAVEGAKVVINAAAPLALTSKTIFDACLRTGVHYLDITGEVPVLQHASSWNAEARRRGVMCMPGVGFDVVSSDCLAAHVAARTRDPRRLSIGLSGLSLLSRGSARTLIEGLSEPTWIRRGGVLRRVPAGSLARRFDYGHGPSDSIAVSWGDVITAHFSTAIPDITTYFEATTAVRLHHTMLRMFGGALPLTPWQQWLGAVTQAMPDGPPESVRATRGAVVVAEAQNDRGDTATSRLHTPEVYSFTAVAAAAVAERVLAGDFEPGFQTPARVYGPDFVLGLPGVRRHDL